MLRCYDELGGIGVYTRNLVQELLRIDRRNRYFLFYRNPANLGRFSHYNNVTERYVRGMNKAIWDQIAIPYACWKDKLEVVFHPKFTVPLMAPCKAVMVVHGADWFISEQARFYKKLDVYYIRTMMPLYFKKSATVISVSKLTTDNFYRVLNLSPGKLKTVYFGPARNFRRIEEESILRNVKARYNLPDKFILTLSRYKGGDRKNIGKILEGYTSYHRHSLTPHKLVVGGHDCDKFKADLGLSDSDDGPDILFPGWIEQEDLPAVYSLAHLFLYPSNLEAFPIPITEAMACGTPIITSNVNGLAEIAGDAALAVNPDDSRSISEAIRRVLSDSNLRATLSGKGLVRAQKFSWDSCAKETLEILENTSS